VAKFVPSKDFQQQLMKAVQPQLKRIEKDLNADLQRRVAKVERTHRGRPESEVLAALEREVRGMGARPNREDLRKVAKGIAEGTP
jgi:hypothetical protein